MIKQLKNASHNNPRIKVPAKNQKTFSFQLPLPSVLRPINSGHRRFFLAMQPKLAKNARKTRAISRISYQTVPFLF
jgi:hypothetical protein